LLGWTPLPPPPHVFVLDDGRLTHGQLLRERHGMRFRGYREVKLPGNAFHSGLLGGPLRDPAAFRELVIRLTRNIPGGVREASLIIPDAWLRVTFTESGDLPRAAEARDEVLRWKLRRLVPFRVDELRIGFAEVAPLPAQGEPRRLLLGFAIEQLLAQVEEAFAAAGVRLGQIANTSLSLLEALPAPGEGDFSALALVDEDGYTLVFARRGEPVLHRYKAFTGSLPEAARGTFVERDLRLTRNFLQEQFPGAALTSVLLVAPPAFEPLWLDRLENGLGQAAAALDGRHLAGVRGDGESLPAWRELAPMVGAARREVA
jgi:hypothetical protein